MVADDLNAVAVRGMLAVPRFGGAGSAFRHEVIARIRFISS